MGLTDETMKLPTQEEVQASYEAAKDAGLSPCLWIPPEWKGVKIDNGKRVLKNNSRDDTGFANPDAKHEALERIREGDEMLAPESPEKPPKPNSWANPFSDFTHIDESEYPSADIDQLEQPMFQDVEEVKSGLGKKLRVALSGPDRELLKRIHKALKGTHAGLRKKVRKALQELVVPKPKRDELILAVKSALTNNTTLSDEVTKEIENAPAAPAELDKEVESALSDAKHANLKKKVKDALAGNDPVGRLKRIVGPRSPGMKRLGLIFEWALHRTTVLLGDINKALEKGDAGQDDYKRARDNYVEFLRDLDNHEPEKNRPELDGTKKKIDKPSGYGRSLKWACIDPVIFGGRIVGARVIIHWNPHSSSNGIPVEHP